MTIFDTHTHLGRNPDIIDARADRLVRSMDEAGIEKALVFAGEINDCPNDWLLQEIAPYRDRLVAIGSISPLQRNPKPRNFTIGECLEDGRMAGLKFYVGYEHFYAGDKVLRPYLELLTKFNRPAIFHTGDLYDKIPGAKLKYARPATIDDAATDFPDLTIIIAHMGWPYVTEAAHVCSKNRNVYADVSGLVYGSFTPTDVKRFERSLAAFADVAPLDKLIFGSDWPICDQTSYVKTVQRMAELRGTPILHETAARLFGLK